MTLVHDADRPRRIGMPEAVLCEGKLDDHLVEIVRELAATGESCLLTRLPAERAERLDLARVAADAAPGPVSGRAGVSRTTGIPDDHDTAEERDTEPRPAAQRATPFEHDPESSTAVLNGVLPTRPGRVAVVAAGTSDLAVAREAGRTLAFSGVTVEEFADVGVAGLWRLLDRVDEIREADVVIAVAGMDAALASVVGGLVAAPVIAVPTSVGYGVAADGATALGSMLASCAQGIVVTNIDNGFGGACAAIRLLGAIDRRSADADSADADGADAGS